jgi:hypothetical protein
MSLKVTLQHNSTGHHHLHGSQQMMMGGQMEDMAINFGYSNQSKRLKCSGSSDIYGKESPSYSSDL